MNRLVITIALVSAFSTACPFGPTEPKQTSGFDVDADGWTIVGDAQADAVVPDYEGTGGNPDGLISASDDVTGGVWYFAAPERYLGDNSDIIGANLGFDLKVDETPPSPFDDADVRLVGGGITIVFDTADN